MPDAAKRNHKMPKELTIESMQSRIDQLEKEVIKHIHKEDELNRKQKFVEYSHIRRTLSLINIIQELHNELSELKYKKDNELRTISKYSSDRIRELDSIYSITKLKSDSAFSMDLVLQSVVDFIPPAMRYPELACARIKFKNHNIQTINFVDTKWKFSKDIMIYDEVIGTLVICYLEKIPQIDKIFSMEEFNNLVAAVTESISQIVERERAEMEIREGRAEIEALIQNKPR